MISLVPLESFRKTVNFHPFHWWGLANVDIPATCGDGTSDLIFEYAWQGDNAGRDDIRQAIETAEARLFEHLGFRIAPQYISETIRFPRYHDTALNNVRYSGADGRWITIQLPEGKVRAAGVEARTLIATVTTNPGGGMVVTDDDGDGLDDTFTITIATSVIDPEQIAVYVGSPYRMDGEGISDKWRVAPTSVSISGGMAIIKGRSWMLVKPILYQVTDLAAIDPTVDSNFIGTLDVVRRYTDPTGTTVDTAQAKLIWETPPYPAWATACGNGASFGDASTDSAAVAQAIARVGIRDAENGIVSLGEAVFDATSGIWGAVNMSFCRPPDRVTLRYLAGDALENGNVQSKWATLVSRFAAAELAKPICACQAAQKGLFAWQLDRAFAGDSALEKWNLSMEDLSNPFGTRAGQIAAWRAIKPLRKFQAVLA